MTVQDEQEKELVTELLKLQIRQTEILNLLVNPQATATEGEGETTDRPLRVGDQVRVLNPPGGFNVKRIYRDTVCTVIRVGDRITSLAPNGYKIIRSAHNLERV